MKEAYRLCFFRIVIQMTIGMLISNKRSILVKGIEKCTFSITTKT